jgi:hypothetical protein
VTKETLQLAFEQLKLDWGHVTLDVYLSDKTSNADVWYFQGMNQSCKLCHMAKDHFLVEDWRCDMPPSSAHFEK